MCAVVSVVPRRLKADKASTYDLVNNSILLIQKSAVEVLQILGPPDPSLDRARAALDQQTQHMTRLVDDLLDMSRISHGKIQLEMRPVDLGDVVRGEVELQRHNVGERLHLELETSESRSGSAATGNGSARSRGIFSAMLASSRTRAAPSG